MAVTTRNKGSPAKPAASAAVKKTAPKQSKKAAPAVDSDEENQDQDDTNEQSNDSDDEDTFKIHTPKAAATPTPRVAPAALPTIKYEDDSDEEDSDDEAPEAESLSSAKAKIQSAQDKEKSFLSKVQAEQKAKRVEREQKLKEQKDQSKATKKKTTTPTLPAAPVPEDTTAAPKPTGLPTMLPMDILESVAQMDDNQESKKSGANDSKKRKHMRPEDFALMELEAELKAEAMKRKRTEKKQKNIGPVTVKVLDKSLLAQGHAIPQTVVDFRQQHFYGSKIQRKDAILNASQRSQGAARKFNRK
ncbi:hypothetical protein EC991_003925 [Linnemannia zychae]|nr:hypothetical protein EC991_003925 [Linnemannia zychae]